MRRSFERAQLHVESSSAGSDHLRSVSAGLTLRDGSGDWDDAFAGKVSYALFTFPPGTVESAVLELGSSGKAEFPVETTGQPLQQQRSVTFEGAIPFQRIIAGLIGFQLAFTREDHHFGRALVRLEHQIPSPGASPTNIRATFEGGLRDLSGTWDDPYSVTANYHLIGAK